MFAVHALCNGDVAVLKVVLRAGFNAKWSGFDISFLFFFALPWFTVAQLDVRMMTILMIIFTRCGGGCDDDNDDDDVD